MFITKMSSVSLGMLSCRPEFSSLTGDRFTTLVLSVVAILFAHPHFSKPVQAESKLHPNIIVILADDLGYGDLSAYGATDLQSPNIDKLISEGMRFDNFYANSSVCSPTRAALLTGRYQDMVGVPGVIRTHADNSWGYLTPDAVLLGSMLKKANYETAIVGKWHLGLDAPNRPTDRGFDVFKGYLGDMMDDYYTHRRHGINYMRDGIDEVDPEGHATELLTQWSCAYIKEHQSSEQPFFLYLAYNAPHTPIQPPPEWVTKVKAREKDMTDQRAAFVALIEHMDEGIGKVLNCLKESDQADNTIVFFTSDNGGQLNVGANNGPLRDGKQSMYEGGIKVPCCVRWPGKIEAGSRSSLQALSMDIFPTALNVAGVEIPANLDGVSFLPTLTGTDQTPLREYAFFRRREGGTQFGGKTIEAVRWGDWKLLQNSPFESLELYHLKDDPLEEKDLSKSEPNIFQQLSSELRQEIQRYGTVPWQKSTAVEP